MITVPIGRHVLVDGRRAIRLQFRSVRLGRHCRVEHDVRKALHGLVQHEPTDDHVPGAELQFHTTGCGRGEDVVLTVLPHPFSSFYA